MDWKEQTRLQWSGHPCGSETSGAPFGSREFFDEVERYRYGVYAPWMKEDIPFTEYAGKQLLEVGVGMGSDHLQWARGGAICTGIDLTERCIEITRGRLELYGQKSSLRQMDAEKLDFPAESFDLVYSFGVLHHTPDTQGAIDEIYRVLKPGGKAIVMLYHRDSWHVIAKLLTVNGIFEGQFADKSLHQTLGEGEYSFNRQALPLVKLYTRSEAMFLFRRWRRVDNIVRQLTRGELSMPSLPNPRTDVTVEVVPQIEEKKNFVRGFAALPGAPQTVVLPGWNPWEINPWKLLFDAINQKAGDISDNAVKELGAVFGWNVVVFAEK